MQSKPSIPPGSLPSATPVAVPLGGLVEMRFITARARELFPHAAGTGGFITDLASLVERLFAGQLWHYQAIDLRYHDYQHTLQAAWTYLDLVEAGRGRLAPERVPSLREAELGFAAILLHDTGYLKARGDDVGSGAKYTYCHVLRSCALAASLLPTLGCSLGEIDDVLGAIRCTGLNGSPAATAFRTATARTVAAWVATADYLGQMAAPEYPDKLPFLYGEFAEADAFAGVPPEKRTFTSLDGLLAATPAFWERFVLPKLAEDFVGMHRLLARPYPDGPNPYLQAIERNIAVIGARVRPSSPVAPN